MFYYIIAGSCAEKRKHHLYNISSEAYIFIFRLINLCVVCNICMVHVTTEIVRKRLSTTLHHSGGAQFRQVGNSILKGRDPF